MEPFEEIVVPPPSFFREWLRLEDQLDKLWVIDKRRVRIKLTPGDLFPAIR